MLGQIKQGQPFAPINLTAIFSFPIKDKQVIKLRAEVALLNYCFQTSLVGETEPFFKISAETILFLEQSSKVKLFSLQSEQAWGYVRDCWYFDEGVHVLMSGKGLEVCRSGMLSPEVCSEVV